MKKLNWLLFLMIIAAVAVVVFAVSLYWELASQAKVWAANPAFSKVGATATAQPLIGGQKDEHGCLIPAGYSWCASKQKCLRVWEEACPEK
jgi:hypothetical protein